MYKYANQVSVKTVKRKKKRSISSFISRHKQAKQKTKVKAGALVALGTVIILFLLWQTIVILEPIVMLFTQQSGVTSDTKSGIHVVVDHGDISLISLYPQSKSASILTVPANTYVTLPNNSGRYRIAAVYDVGEMQKPGQGGLMLKEVSQNLFAVPIDGYIKTEKPFTLASDAKQSLYSKATSYFIPLDIMKSQGFANEMQTNLTSADLLKLWWYSRKVSPHKLAMVDFMKNDAMQEIILADGSSVLGISTDDIDRTMEDILSQENILQEDLSVAVINASEVVGAGQQFARIVANLGGKIVRVENGDTKEKGSKIIVRNQRDNKRIIGELLKLKNFTIMTEEIDTPLLEDITIILAD